MLRQFDKILSEGVGFSISIYYRELHPFNNVSYVAWQTAYIFNARIEFLPYGFMAYENMTSLFITLGGIYFSNKYFIENYTLILLRLNIYPKIRTDNNLVLNNIWE